VNVSEGELLDELGADASSCYAVHFHFIQAHMGVDNVTVASSRDDELDVQCAYLDVYVRAAQEVKEKLGKFVRVPLEGILALYS